MLGPALSQRPVDVQGAEPSTEEEVREEKFQSAVPLFPPLSEQTVQMYWQFYVCAVGFIILFGGLLSPILEVRMGLGGELCRWQHFRIHQFIGIPSGGWHRGSWLFQGGVSKSVGGQEHWCQACPV